MSEDPESWKAEQDRGTVFGIPVWLACVFGVGILAAIAAVYSGWPIRLS